MRVAVGVLTSVHMCIHLVVRQQRLLILSLFASVGLAIACDGPTQVPANEPKPNVEPAGIESPAAEQPAPKSGTEVAELSLAQAQAIVDATDRSADDRKTDERRKPAQTLAFLQLYEGMRVADIGAGFGYTTELLARAVGQTGHVYGQNPAFVLEKFAEKPWTERLQKPVMAQTTRLDREFSDPFPDELHGSLDRVINVLFYHDFVWMETDRAAHNSDVFAALKPGGLYVVIDHSAAAGAGVSGSKTLHRIEESVLRSEVEAAGFEFVESAEFLRNPADTRDFNALPWRGEGDGQLSDKFVLKFRKPNTAVGS